jgi:hypothetical protein
MTAACGGQETPTADAASGTPSATPTRSSSPSPTIPSATATLDPQPAVHDCQPVVDEALVSQLAATIRAPYDDPLFALNGVVSLRTDYEGDSWTYLAARLGPSIDGNRQHVATWALPDGQSPVGLHLSIETDGDDGFELEVNRDAAFSSPARPAPTSGTTTGPASLLALSARPAPRG